MKFYQRTVKLKKTFSPKIQNGRRNLQEKIFNVGEKNLAFIYFIGCLDLRLKDGSHVPRQF